MTSIQRGNYKYKTDSIVFLSNYIIKKNLFPSIFFCFSKKKCHDHANKILKQFLNENEKKEVLKIIQEKLSKLNAYKNLPQVVEITKLLINGIAIHHSGLLSFLKELVEILFSKGLIKIIIATETFSVGVNFPAKSVVFLKLKKMSDDGMRLLNSGEFMQMSGRAGRRGKDKKGIVIINSNDSKTIISLINGKSFLESKFRLNFSMILRMLRIKIKVEDVLRKSFGEEKMQKNGFKEVKKLSKLEKIYMSLLNDLKNNIGEESETKNISVINCKICNDIKEYIQKYKEFYKANNKLIKKFLNKKNYKTFTYILKNSIEFFPKSIEHNKIFGKGTKTIFESKLYDELISERKIDYVYFNNENNENIDISFSEILVLKEENEYFFDYNFENYKDKLEELHVKKLFLDLNEHICIKCPDFKIHYNQMLKTTILKEEIEKIKFCLSDSNLNLIKEYYEKIYFLIQNEYIDEDLNLLVKGRIACEIRSVDEIFMTELVSRNLIKKMKNEDFLGFVSGFINFEIIDEENEISKNLINYVLNEFSCKVNDKQEINYKFMDQKCFIGYYEFKFGNLYFNAIKDWCLGKKLCEIVILHKVSEGTIVKIVMRLIEFLKEMQNVCTFVNDSELHNKIEECLNCLERDIVSSASLYFDQ
ncbi:Antiviral helicase ski2 [Gurleya vavrai]